MSKFWPIVTALLLVGIMFNLMPGEQPENGINFTELETECRYDRVEDSRVSLQERKISFEGQFPIETPNTFLSYDYQKSEDRIVLNIGVKNATAITNFLNTCKGLAIYQATTDRLEEGRYLVEVRHKGETQSKRVIGIR